MNIFLLIQDEPFHLYKYLPELIKRHNVVGVTLLSQKLPSDTWLKTIAKYYTLFGCINFLRLSVLTVFRNLSGLGSLNKLVKKYNIPVIPTVSINNENYIKKVADYQPDLLISIACPQILKKKLITIPAKGALNLHGGYLPDFPGVFTPFWNLLKDSEFAGCTVHFINENIDAGPILKRIKFRIEKNDTVQSLYDKISRYGISLLIEAIDDIENQKTELLENKFNTNNYSSFPTEEQVKQFRKKGCKFL